MTINYIFYIIYIVYHLDRFTLFQRNKKVEAQLKFNVDDQQSDMDDADKILEITAARTSKKNE